MGARRVQRVNPVAPIEPPLDAVPLYRAINRNAETSAYSYREPHERTLNTYERSLIFDRDQIEPGDVVIDSGGGAGIAALSLALGRGANAVVINTQDFFGPIQRSLSSIARGSKDVIRLSSYGEGLTRLTSIGGLEPQKLASLAEAAGLASSRFSTWRSLDVEDLHALEHDAKQLAEKILGCVDQGLFAYERGYAEEVLPKYAGKARLITDLWGAFSYSPDRHRLLELFYASLRGDGEARVLVSHKASSEVRTDRGWIDLVDYLIERMPTVFSAKTCPVSVYGRAKVLIMHRDPNLERLDLGIDRVEARPRMGQFSTPRLVFEERRARSARGPSWLERG